METKNPLIYQAIIDIIANIGAIDKTKKNMQQGFMFRGIDQVMNELHPLLHEHGVFIVPEILETHREERTTQKGGNLIYTIHKIRFTFIASDGSHVAATVVGEGMDSADKSSNKAMAVAFKYACFQVFCIPTEEIAKEDPDAYSPEPSTVSQENLLRFIENCESVADLRDLCNMYGTAIQGNKTAFEAYQKKKESLR